MEKTNRVKKDAAPYTQRNFCGECGCGCTCDGGCKGDVKKCTSKKALEKNCKHCCDCYIGPMIVNFDNNLSNQTKSL